MRKSKLFLSLGFLGLSCILFPSVSKADTCGSVVGNMVSNCGFESGNLNGWTLSNGAPWDGVGTGLVHSGTYAMGLGNEGAFGDADLSQTLTTTPGQTYLVDFFVANDGSSDADNKMVRFEFFWDGAANNYDYDDRLLDIESGPTFPYTEYSFNVMGTGSDSISFLAINDIGNFHIDSVSVVPTPEPSTLALLAVGLVGLAVLSRRKLASAALPLA
jgi:flagellin